MTEPLFDLISRLAIRIRAGQLPWDDFEQEIQRQSVIREWAAAIQASPVMPLRRVQDFLAGFAIAFYDIEPTLAALALAWIAAAEARNPPAFQSAVAAYATAYRDWKTNDRLQVLERLAQMYWEYQMSYELGINDINTNEEKEYYTSLLKHRQDELLSQMDAIDGQQYFRAYLPITVGPDVSALIRETLERAFWNRIKEDITTDPPNYTSLLPVIQELADIAKQLDPSRRDWYDDIFDTKFINEQIHNQNSLHGANTLLPFSFWQQRLDAAIETLIVLDSEANAPIHAKWHNEHPPTNPAAAVDTFAYVLRRMSVIRDLKESLSAARRDL